MILVDTSIWSLALRRNPRHRSRTESLIVDRWSELAAEGEAGLIGAIRQEVLSGIRHREQFEQLRNALDAFPCLRVSLQDHDRAAECFNACRARGVAGTAIDMLICAVGRRHDLPIMSVDVDYRHYASCLSIRLFPLPQ